jgi:hypothetical protein
VSKHLSRGSTPILAGRSSLSYNRQTSNRMGKPMSTDLHTELRSARRAHQRSEYALATLLLELKTSRRFDERGHACVEDYAFVELDLPVRQTRDLIAIAKRLHRLPVLAEAFKTGRLGYTKAREVIRVATTETDAAWTQRACESTSRTLERQGAAATPGSPPPDDPTLTPGPARLTLRFEMSAAQAEVLRHTLARLRLDGGFGDDVDDGLLLAEMARRIAHDLDAAASEDTTSAPTAERFRVSIHRCPSCENTHVGDPRAPHQTDTTDAACAECDAEVLDETAPGQRLTHAIPPATRRRVIERDGHRCAVPYCRNRLWLDLHHIRPRHAGGDHRPANLVSLCSTHHQMIHRHALFIVADPASARVTFVLPTGEVVGDRRAGGPTLQQTAAEMERAITTHPGQTGRALTRGRPDTDEGGAATALGVLRALGRVVTRPDDTWHPAGAVLAGG